MVTVYIWFSKKPGHSALLVQNTYISWMPVESSADGSFEGPPLHFFGSRWARFSENLQEDMERLKNIPPTDSIRINGLEENKILSWWQSFREHHQTWNLYRWNCHKVVISCLEKGSNIKWNGFSWQSSDARMHVNWENVLAYSWKIKELFNT